MTRKSLDSLEGGRMAEGGRDEEGERERRENY